MTFNRFAVAEGWYWWLTHHDFSSSRLHRMRDWFGLPEYRNGGPTTAEAQAVYDRLCVEKDICCCQEAG